MKIFAYGIRNDEKPALEDWKSAHPEVEHDTERDYWMSAEETLEYGFIDGILTKSGEKPVVK
ncbi:hypothetical protein GQS40_02870|uniref:ATP-dependent Clp protease proteolytic subunit n=1 Tax=Leuconostoc lactis TaxID=1246 RepID=A0A6L7AA69_LEULA|nr:hypothetical protein [Leuconostoc lactis]